MTFTSLGVTWKVMIAIMKEIAQVDSTSVAIITLFIKYILNEFVHTYIEYW